MLQLCSCMVYIGSSGHNGWQEASLQQHVTVVGAVHLDIWLNEDETDATQFQYNGNHC